MPNAQRGVVKPSNIEGPKGNRAANGSVPLTHDASMVHPAKGALRGGDPGGSGSLARQASPVMPPNHRFEVDNVGNSQYNDFPIQPGTGAVPVNPSESGLTRSLPIADMARAK